MRTLATLVAATALAAGAAAQTDGSSRLHATTQKPRKITYEMASGTLRPEKGPSAFLGPAVVYNNTCILTTLFFAGMSPTDVFLDNGEVPSSSNGQLPGCDDSMRMSAFTIGYCSDQAAVDLRVTFHELHDNCTDIASATGSTAVYSLAGLPGSNTSVALCWTLTVDLVGTTLEWPFLADGDGVWNADPALDTFGTTYEITNVTGTATGIILAGHPIYLGNGCDFAVGTVYQHPDSPDTSPLGTGYGSTDSFGLMNAGAYVGCFFFGGWPANPWSSYYLIVWEEDPGCASGCSQVVCDGTGTNPVNCPCSNNNGGQGDQGCVHTGGVGGSLTICNCSSTDFAVLAENLPPGNGGIFLVGTVQTGGAAVFDGITCTGGSTLRVLPGFETAPGVRETVSGALIAAGNAASPGYFAVGNSYFMTYWFRDVAAGPSPCGSGANFTTTLTFTLS